MADNPLKKSNISNVITKNLLLFFFGRISNCPSRVNCNNFAQLQGSSQIVQWPYLHNTTAIDFPFIKGTEPPCVAAVCREQQG